MRTRVAEFDIRSPQPLWGLDGCDWLALLVRDRQWPLALLSIPTPVGVAALGAADVARLVSDWMPLGAYPLREVPQEPSESPAITVIVCTKDRPNPLDRCLESLREVRYERYELIVVDNGSADDATARIAAKHGARCVREDRPGLDHARNRGIDEARHDIVAFTDDDVRVDPGWLTGLAIAFEDRRVDAVTGLVLPLELETPAQNLFESYGGMKKGFHRWTLDPARLTDHERIAVQHVGVGANMAARKVALEELGGFDPALDVGTVAGGGGDLDMFHRLLAAGKRVRYEPSALLWHQHRRDMVSLTSQLHANGRSFGVYLLKVFRDRTVPRRSLVRYAGWTWARWLVGRMVVGLLGRHRLPRRLLWAELKGALGSPFAFFATYRQARAPREARLEA